MTTSLAKRRRIAELAQQHGFYIVEDSPTATCVTGVRTCPPCASWHRSRPCTSVRFRNCSARACGGFLIGPKSLMPRLHKWSEDTYIHPTLVSEGIVYEYCRRGLLEPNIAKLKAVYRPRMEAMLAALRSDLPQGRWTETDGGFSSASACRKMSTATPCAATPRNLGLFWPTGGVFSPTTPESISCACPSAG